MSKLRVAALQMVSGPLLDDNLASAARLIARAAESGAQLAVLPESFPVFGDREAIRTLALREASPAAPLRAFLSAQARQHGIALVGGTVPVAADDGRARAVAAVFDASGRCVAEYDKIHLFDAQVDDATGDYRESRDYSPGSELVVADSGCARLGLAVCYDIRFPEMFRPMLEAGMEILTVPAAFTRATGQAHWLALLRARAIENQCVVIGANQGGEHSAKRQTSGGSVIIDAWGRVLAEAGYGESCVLADIDLAAVRSLRRRMPVVEHRRFSVKPGRTSDV